MTPVTGSSTDFSTISILELADLAADQLDAFPFGIVGLSSQGIVEVYSATESRLAGLPSATVIGSPFFLSVAQCMNNFMVAQRFEEEEELDVTLPYVLTFRMRPTPVTLRLLKTKSLSRSYLLIKR